MLFRLDICDLKTGIPLFEKVWKFIGTGTALCDGICKLMLTFFKMSKEMGDNGDVTSVMFEPNGPLPQFHYRASSSGGSLSSSSSSSKRNKTVITPQTRMACARTDLIAASVFHDLTGT
eukprot:TRINITY_DN3820_c0_g1_i1.p1 TRINITY_DN3820_c0_g1~~TRINITY_DN3820_c0_g1_i1.p1  ORF type:complete len:119 (+),score=7.72 TRINITY_DN3820_c0_g1_i1:329-685(+)